MAESQIKEFSEFFKNKSVLDIWPKQQQVISVKGSDTVPACLEVNERDCVS